MWGKDNRKGNTRSWKNVTEMKQVHLTVHTSNKNESLTLLHKSFSGKVSVFSLKYSSQLIYATMLLDSVTSFFQNEPTSCTTSKTFSPAVLNKTES